MLHTGPAPPKNSFSGWLMKNKTKSRNFSQKPNKNQENGM
jgi:hypothetical protein